MEDVRSDPYWQDAVEKYAWINLRLEWEEIATEVGSRVLRNYPASNEHPVRGLLDVHFKTQESLLYRGLLEPVEDVFPEDALWPSGTGYRRTALADRWLQELDRWEEKLWTVLKNGGQIGNLLGVGLP